MKRAQVTKEKIERAALTLFAERSFAGTSIKEIASMAGITDAALYRHYPSKEAMGNEIFHKYYSGMASLIAECIASEQTTSARIKAIINTFGECFNSDPTLFRFLLLTQHTFLNEMPRGKENIGDIIAEMMAEGIRSKELTIKDPVMASAILIGSVLQTAVFSLYSRLPKDIRDIETEVFKTLMLSFNSKG